MSTSEMPERSLKLRDESPPFEEPWHAQVLAIADLSIGAGRFTRSAWSAALGAEIQTAHQNGEPDSSETFYQAALSALEYLLAKAGSISVREIDEREEAWEHAYLRTPHGRPVFLLNPSVSVNGSDAKA